MSRDRRAGISLIETLVVVALLAIMASAAVLSLPDPARKEARANEALTLVALIERAQEHSLTRQQPFGLAYAKGELRFVLPYPDGPARAHPDKVLASVKLSLPQNRISLRSGGVFAVSERFIPSGTAPFRVTFGAEDVVFDGARVRILERDEQQRKRQGL